MCTSASNRDGTTTYEKDVPVNGTCTWKFSGGTGKLKGLTGKGTCNGKFDATGAAVFDIEGEYQVPGGRSQGEITIATASKPKTTAVTGDKSRTSNPLSSEAEGWIRSIKMKATNVASNFPISFNLSKGADRSS